MTSKESTTKESTTTKEPTTTKESTTKGSTKESTTKESTTKETPKKSEETTQKSANEEVSKEADSKTAETSIYISKIPNQLVITMNPRTRKRLSFFINRACRILRSDETLVVTGVDKAISMACALVELLKRQKIAHVTKIATNMNLTPNFRRSGRDVGWGVPAPTIVFQLKRGEYGTYVSDYQQRKVIEIFESRDPQHAGKLSKKVIEELKLPEVFLAEQEQQQEAKKFIQSRNELDLPNFVRYCSLLIHPLLKDSVFKQQLVSLGIGATDEPEPQTTA